MATFITLHKSPTWQIPLTTSTRRDTLETIESKTLADAISKIPRGYSLIGSQDVMRTFDLYMVMEQRGHVTIGRGFFQNFI